MHSRPLHAKMQLVCEQRWSLLTVYQPVPFPAERGMDRALYGAKTGNKGCCLWLGEEQPLRLQVEVKEQENLKTAGKMAREVHNEEV